MTYSGITRKVLLTFSVMALFGMLASAQLQGQDTAKPPLYNTAKQKLLEGKQVFSFTQWQFDIPAYCEAAKH